MAKNKTIRILIADDHAIVCEGLKNVLVATRDLSFAGQAHTGLDAIKLARNSDADVMLLDISLPDRSGIDVLKQIKKEAPQLHILMFSGHREDQYAIRSLKAGAAGYLNKQCAPSDIITAIRQVASGLKYISPSLAQELANQIGENHDVALHETLSDREYQTLLMIAAGKTISDIAAELSLSVKTISEYRARLLVKMKLRNSAELTHYAIRHQLIE
jgi:DNA-binding NarL/FixJ family response regulator